MLRKITNTPEEKMSDRNSKYNDEKDNKHGTPVRETKRKIHRTHCSYPAIVTIHEPCSSSICYDHITHQPIETIILPSVKYERPCPIYTTRMYPYEYCYDEQQGAYSIPCICSSEPCVQYCQCDSYRYCDWWSYYDHCSSRPFDVRLLPRVWCEKRRPKCISSLDVWDDYLAYPSKSTSRQKKNSTSKPRKNIAVNHVSSLKKV